MLITSMLPISIRMNEEEVVREEETGEKKENEIFIKESIK